MATQVRLFVSAGPAEDPVRELFGRALAELPVNVGWVIKRTPDVDSVPECHLFVVVLGADITAPVGLECWWARRTEKPVLAYAAAISRTPAGQVFYQDNITLDWTRFTELAALRREFLQHVSRFLLAHPDRYGLSIVEVETLRSFVATLEKAPPPSADAQKPQGELSVAKARGAGGGGVILAPGKDAAPGARLVGEGDVGQD
jgi:hypothetical protein